MIDLFCSEDPKDEDCGEPKYISLEDRLADAQRRSDETDDGAVGTPEQNPLDEEKEI